MITGRYRNSPAHPILLYGKLKNNGLKNAREGLLIMLDELLAIKHIREGNIKAFEKVFRLYYSSLVFYSYGITGRKEIAEEIIQEIFYRLWKERENIRVTHSLKSYLYAAVRNESLQHNEHIMVRERYRQQLLSAEKTAPEPSPHEDLEYRELESIINRTLINMPERRRRIFQMHRYEGLKYKEIAERLSLSVKTIEAEMTKTYQALRKEIEKFTYTV